MAELMAEEVKPEAAPLLTTDRVSFLEFVRGVARSINEASPAENQRVNEFIRIQITALNAAIEEAKTRNFLPESARPVSETLVTILSDSLQVFRGKINGEANILKEIVTFLKNYALFPAAICNELLAGAPIPISSAIIP